MAVKVRLFSILFFSIMGFQSVCWAEASTLLKMAVSKQENMSRVFFFFDRIPEFEMEQSGQRIRLILPQTVLSSALEPLSPNEIFFRIHPEENLQLSMVELYLRNMPAFVDIQIDQQSARLIMNIFVDQKRAGSRPAILDKRIGELKPLKGGAVAQKIISSEYSGRWIEFFKEFELPVTFSLPIHFSFPQFPSPLVIEYENHLPKDAIEGEMEAICAHVFQKSTTIALEDKKSRWQDLYKLIWAECLLIEQDWKTASNILEQVSTKTDPNNLLATWKWFYQAHSRAISGRHFQATNFVNHFQEEMFLGKDFTVAWYRIFQAELELAKGNPEASFQILQKDIETDAFLTRMYGLRKADSLYALGQTDKAAELYEKTIPDLHLIQNNPYSLANWADILYSKNDFSKAYRYYLFLNEILKDSFPEQKALSAFRSAMAILKKDGKDTARTLLSQIAENNAETEAAYRSRLKLTDLDVLSDFKPPLTQIQNEYSNIATFGPNRMLREEAFFKKILVYHLYEENLRAVKHLGRFFEDFWAGELLSEAQALFVEIFPKAIRYLIEQDASFVGLSLIAKHRDLLAHAQFDYDFLHDLANHYYQTGLLEQVEKTYLYMLDFEKNEEKKEDIFFRLIQTLYQQKKYDQVEDYASLYFRQYPEGAEKGQILYYYADVLIKKGEYDTAASLLLEKNRPENKKLDHLAGNLFFEMGQYELADHYISLAIEGNQDPIPPEIILKRAEALFLAQNWEKAAILYESLLDKPQFSGQAAYRLIRAFIHLGKNENALKLYEKLTELPIEGPWLKLADETVQAQNFLTRDN